MENTTIVYENEFIFNEVEYFTRLIEKEKLDKNILDDMQLVNEDFRFVYQKDNKGSWFMFCYKNNEKISWNNVPHWMREYVWEFEKENNMYFN